MNKKGTYFISSLSAVTSITEFGVGLIFILFLMNGLHYTDSLTSLTYAYVFIFVYLLPIPLGFIKDKYLSNNFALNIGLIMTIISQFLLFFSASMYVPSTPVYDTIILNTQNLLFFVGMLFFAFGVSFVNLGFSHILNIINTVDNKRLNAYSILYSMINFGAIIGILIMTVFVGDTNYASFKWGFLTFGILLIIGFISYNAFKSRLLIDIDGNPFREKSTFDYYAMKNEFNTYIINNIISKTKITKNKFLKMGFWTKLKVLCNSLSKHEKDRIQVFFLFIFILILYRIAFYQFLVSMIFFIKCYSIRDLGFYTIPIQLFSILNPILVLILGPVIVKFNNSLEKRNIEIGLTKRLIIGLLLMTIAYAILSVPCYFIDLHYISHVSIIWVVLYILVLSLSEMFLSITGYAVVTKLAPKNYLSVFFGIFLSVQAFGLYFSGLISQFFPEDPSSVIKIGFIPFNGLFEFFSIFLLMTLISAIGLFIFKNKINKKKHLEDFQGKLDEEFLQ